MLLRREKMVEWTKVVTEEMNRHGICLHQLSQQLWVQLAAPAERLGGPGSGHSLAAAPPKAVPWFVLIQGCHLKAFLKLVNPVWYFFPAPAVSKPRIACSLGNSIPLSLKHHRDPSR